jgi:feruloyl-CoA synthase
VPDLRDVLTHKLAAFNAGRGQSERVARVLLLTEPPSADHHEVSDKGTINQRVTIQRRASDVAKLYADPPAADLIQPSVASG